MAELVAARLIVAFPLPVIAVDRRMRVVAANPPAMVMLGDELVDRLFVTIIRHPSVNATVEWMTDGQPGNPPLESDLRLGPPPAGGIALRAVLSARGREITCDIHVAPLAISSANGAMITLIDRTEIEQTERMRRDFVANVSHELRTPLTALTGFIETLRGSARDDPAARDRFLGIMEREASRMNRLVSDLLSLSKVEASERRRPNTDLDIAALTRGAAAALSELGRASEVEIATKGLDDELRVTGDADQLTQVFHNLIENAIKYGGTGGQVTITGEILARDPQLRGPAIAITVADDGAGIDPIHLPRLTERFYRVDTGRSRAKGGTGLGLAIVKHILHRHHGRLSIQSTPGQGSRFRVILPAKCSG